MNKTRNNLSRTIKHLKNTIENDDVVTFAAIVREHGCALTFQAIREQKILLRASAQKLETFTALLIKASKRLLKDTEAEQFGNYLAFLSQFRVARSEIQERLAAVLKTFPKINLEELSGVAGEVLRQLLRDLSWPAPGASQTVADYERKIQNINTYAADIMQAILRAMNETSKSALDIDGPNLSRSVRQSAERRLLGATKTAAELNALEWVFDSVSYGDLIISHIIQGRTPIVRLEYADVRRTLILILANRRSLILDRNRARAPRFTRDILAKYETSVLESAIKYYCNITGIDSSAISIEKLRSLSDNILIKIGAGDDLLIAASKGNAAIWTYYFTAIVLHWFSLAANAVRDALPLSQRRRFSPLSIPLGQIASRIGGVERNHVNDALKILTCTLPVKSHYQMIRSPFFRDNSEFAHHITLAESGQWATSIRDALINGGRIGDAYGRIWEDFLQQSFKDSDWEVLGQNLKLRENGKLLTDVDLLAKRGNLLLIIQIKAMVGAGFSPYDHWRNRQTIEWGCRQAATATNFCRRTPQWLNSVAGHIKAGQIHHVQPLVLTNLNQFDGWKYEDVPVIGEVGRKSITQGSKVVYSSAQTGEAITTRYITKPEDLSTERILWTLENPVELLIAPERQKTTYRMAAAAGLQFELPQFEITPAENDIAVIQPGGQQ